MNAFIQELFQAGVYKRSQGRVTRQVTFAAIAVMVALGCWRLNQQLGSTSVESYAVPGVLLLLGLWVGFRLVNMPAFADFLIAVEAEMNKVSWPTRSELIRSSIVVLVTMFALAFVLLLFDTFWTFIFTQVLQIIPR